MNKTEWKKRVIQNQQAKNPNLTDEEAYEAYIEQQRLNGAKAKTVTHGFKDVTVASEAGKKSSYRGFRDTPGLAKEANKKSVEQRRKNSETTGI